MANIPKNEFLASFLHLRCPMRSPPAFLLQLLSIQLLTVLGWSPLFYSLPSHRFRLSSPGFRLAAPCKKLWARKEKAQTMITSRSNVLPTLLMPPTIEIPRPKIRWTVPSTKPGWQDTNGQWHDEVCIFF